MKTAPHIALCSLLLVCGCILLFELVIRNDASGSDRDDISGPSLREEDYPNYVLYAEAVADKNRRTTASLRAQRGLYPERAPDPRKGQDAPPPKIKVADFPSYAAYAKAVTEANRKLIKLMAAERGDVDAQLELGLQYLHGNGVAQDYRLALKWLDAAAESGSAYAKAVTEANIKSIKLMAAERGDVDAQLELGLQSLYADEVPQDYDLAAKWLGAAANNGSAKAQYELGMMYVRAQGFEQDYETAERWIRLSAQQGLASAQHQLAMAYVLGFGIEKNEALALQWYLMAAEQGYPETQWHLAAVYSGGLLGAEKDPDLALRYYKLAAEQGHPEAQARLGYAYFFGEGVEADIEASYRWNQAAAKQGVARSQFILGYIYLGGGAVPDSPIWDHLEHEQFMLEDKVRAQMWFLLAAENGDEGAELWTQVFEERLTYHEAQLARELAETCRKSSYRSC